MKSHLFLAALVILIAFAVPANAQVCGDADGSGQIDIADMVYLFNYIISHGPAPVDPAMVNMDRCDEADMVDIAALANYLFGGGDELVCEGTGNCTPTTAGFITLDQVSGQAGPGQIVAGQPITFFIRYTNPEETDYLAISNGFAVSSPDGANWGSVTVDTLGLSREDFYFGIWHDEYPTSGSGADTIAFAGITSSGMSGEYYGVEAGFDEVAFSITIGPFDEQDIGKTICLDSAFFEPAGPWKWTENGDGWVTPEWDGPHCFQIVAPPTALLTLDHVDGLTPEGLLGTREPVTFNIRATNNTGELVAFMENCFRVWSPDGAQWFQTDVDMIDAMRDDYFDIMSLANCSNCDGAGADTIQYVHIAALEAEGLPVGYDGVPYTITIGPIDPIYEGQMICLDSARMPPNLQWLWQHCCPTDVYPFWDGPHCFRVGNTGLPDRELVVAPELLSFIMLEGGANPDPQIFSVTEIHASAIAFDVEEDAGWVSLGGVGVTTPDDITVSIDGDALLAGEYETTITIASEEAVNSPQTVTIRLQVIAGEHDGVSLAYVMGQCEPGTIYAGQPVTFGLRYANASTDYIFWATNSYRVYSPDGAQWTSLVADTTGVINGDMFDGGQFLNYFGVTGSGADTAIFGNIALHNDGMPPGFDDIALTITIGPIDVAHVGKTICLDSAWTPPAGDWMWGLLSSEVFPPPWTGPHCFTIAEPAPNMLIIPSVSTYTPGTQPVDVQAGQTITGASIPIKIPEGVEILDISRAGLITEDWDYVTSYIRADSGFLYVALANSFEATIPEGQSTVFNIRFHVIGAQCDDISYVQWDTALYDDVMRNMIFVSNDYLPIFPGFNISQNITEVLGIMPADFDGNGQVDIADLVGSVNFMFHGGDPPVSLNALDVNGDCRGPDVSDLVYMVKYHFSGGLEPQCGCVEKALRAAPLTGRVALYTSYEEGVTVVRVNSDISLRGMEFELIGASETVPVKMIDDRLDLIAGVTEQGYHIGLLDMDGSEYLTRGEYELIRLDGEHLLSSAVVTDMGFNSLTPLINEKLSLVPEKFELYQNYPNPFNPNTEIGFALPEASHVKLEIYNIAGRRVATLVDECLEANSYLIEWNGTDYNGQSVASGVYLYRLDAGQYVETKKMILLK